MRPRPEEFSRKRGRTWTLRAVLPALLLGAFFWAIVYGGAEARVKRATARVVRVAEKAEEESPVSLGLSANRLGKFLATNAVLELEGYGTLATGRKEIVSFFAQVRSALAQIEFARPEITVAAAGQGAVNARVAARYRLASAAGEAAEGDGTVDLLWNKGAGGWRISRAELRAAEGARLPGGWK